MATTRLLAKLRATVVGFSILIILTVAHVGAAKAHLDFESSSPSNKAELNKSIKKITLTFTNPGQPVGSGIVLYDQDGNQRTTQLSTPDSGQTWVVEADERLRSGAYGVKWKVAAPDSHPKSGKLTFSIVEAGTSSGPADSSPTSTAQLEEALTEVVPVAAQWVRWLGLAFVITGCLTSVGGLIILVFVIAGRPPELRRLLNTVRLGAAVVIGGTLIQVWADSSLRQEGDWFAAIRAGNVLEILGQDGYVWSIALRLVGAVLLIAGLAMKTRVAPSVAQPRESSETFEAVDVARSPLALLGAVGLLISFLFDGHTVTTTPRWLVMVSDVSHVLAAATWTAGLLFVTIVLFQRKTSKQRYDGSYMAIRFSSLASLSVALVGLSGAAMAWVILEYPSQLWTTSWGQLLVLKVLLVTVVSAMGTYNHFRLLPLLKSDIHVDLSSRSMDANPSKTSDAGGLLSVATVDVGKDAEIASQRLLRTVAFELVILVVVVAVTALLVNAATVT